MPHHDKLCSFIPFGNSSGNIGGRGGSTMCPSLLRSKKSYGSSGKKLPDKSMRPIEVGSGTCKILEFPKRLHNVPNLSMRALSRVFTLLLLEEASEVSDLAAWFAMKFWSFCCFAAATSCGGGSLLAEDSGGAFLPDRGGDLDWSTLPPSRFPHGAAAGEVLAAAGDLAVAGAGSGLFK